MMQELERIVQKLDNETVSLEESLDLYQRGMGNYQQLGHNFKMPKKGE